MTDIISIIVPVYNAEKYIRETVESVLAQTYDDWELLLIDDCSSDSSCEIIDSFDDPRIRLIKQPENKGAYAARNRGLKEAEGRYIAFLDADDLWEKEKLEHELAYAKRLHTCNAGLVGTKDSSAKPLAQPTAHLNGGSIDRRLLAVTQKDIYQVVVRRIVECLSLGSQVLI